MPKRIKRKRPLTADDGSEVGMEEYYDYVFPDEAAAAPNLKLLEAAYRWKRQKTQAGGGGGAGEEGGQQDKEGAD
jgi:crooked neck